MIAHELPERPWHNVATDFNTAEAKASRLPRFRGNFEYPQFRYRIDFWNWWFDGGLSSMRILGENEGYYESDCYTAASRNKKNLE